jgi:Domain of unknown function (DUF4270)
VNRRLSFFYFSLFIAVSSSIILSCTRINDATDLGDGLIPLVDNVNTFDTTITVETYNDSFWLSNPDPLLTDSFRMSKGATHILGKITNDPLFGSTDAKIYLQLKPINYKYAFENHFDSLFLDSVVLILDYVESYGDSNALQTVQVSEIAPSNVFRYDSSYLVRQAMFSTIGVLGQKTFAPNILNDSIKAYQDTTNNQLRIKLSDAFGTRLLQYDSTATGAYFSDSAFNSKFRGFAIESTNGGNALMGFNLASGKTRLALYYKYGNVNRDTTVRYFTFDGVSANANYITRNNYTGSQALSTFGGGQDALVYLQNTPGTFARIKIPGLLNTPNCVVHRAELIAEQIYDPSDDLFDRPDALLVDVLDTALKNYRYMPYDFQYDGTSGTTNGGQLGYAGKKTVDAFGNPITVWKFNISRYVQNVLTRREPLHELRILTAAEVFDIYQPSILGGAALIPPTGLNASIGRGRVRLAGGNYADPTKKMRLRIVFSRI